MHRQLTYTDLPGVEDSSKETQECNERFENPKYDVVERRNGRSLGVGRCGRHLARVENVGVGLLILGHDVKELYSAREIYNGMCNRLAASVSESRRY